MRLVVILGLAGLVCILLSGLLPSDDSKESTSPVQESSQCLTNDSASYVSQLEKRLESMLTQIESVGNCRVMLTVSGGERYSYAQDSQRNIEKESHEIQQKHVILDNGNVDAPLIEQVENPQITGVIIACEGGNSHVVQEQVYTAMQAVLDVPSSRICVTKLKSESEE